MARKQHRRSTEWRLYRRKNSPFYWARRTENGQQKRRSTGYSTKRHAENEIRKWNERDSNPLLASSDATLGDAVARAKITCQRRSAKATVRAYNEKWGHLLRVVGSDRLLSDLTSGTFRDYIAERQTTRTCRIHVVDPSSRAPCQDGLCQTGVAGSTVKKDLTVCRLAIEAAIEMGWLAVGSEQLVPTFKASYVARDRWLPFDEALALVNFVGSLSGERRAAHLAFFFGTGARAAEARRARREDISSDYVRLRGTKTKDAAAEIPITPIMRPWIDRVLAGAPRRADGLLFDPWVNMARALRNATKSLGIAHVSPNDCRRSFCSWHVQAGVPLEDVAKLMRHSSVSMVERVYGKDTKEAHRARLERLDLKLPEHTPDTPSDADQRNSAA